MTSLQSTSQNGACMLVIPDARYRDSYVAMLREHQALNRFSDNRHIDNDANRIEKNFEDFVAALHALADETKLRPGRVAEQHFWMISNDEVVARSTFRRELSEDPTVRDLGHIGYDVRPSVERRGLGKLVLVLTLQKARESGLERVLLTCDSNNLPSKRIIEVGGGKLERAVPIPGRAYQRLRYWIDL